MPRFVAVNSGHDCLQRRFSFSRERTAGIAWCRVTSELPNYGIGRAFFRLPLSIAKAQIQSARLVFVVKSSVYYTPIRPETLGPAPTRSEAENDMGQTGKWPKTGSQRAPRPSPIGSYSYLVNEFAGGKHGLLLPFDSRLIRIGCEQFKLSS